MHVWVYYWRLLPVSAFLAYMRLVLSFTAFSVVTPVFKENDVSPKIPDNRRNLYVLGIPFDLNKFVPPQRFCIAQLTIFQSRICGCLFPLRQGIPLCHFSYSRQCFTPSRICCHGLSRRREASDDGPYAHTNQVLP